MVTGATGFVGSRFCEYAENSGRSVRRALRNPDQGPGVAVGEIGPETDWSKALKDIDAVVHLAARVHVMEEKAADPLAEFRHVNVDGTVNLARQAARAGVRRFIFISSVKVNGESTLPGRPFTQNDHPAPGDPYAVSKYEAEKGLKQVADETDLETVIIRPPLVYGPGVRANFLRMIRAVQKGLPLPLAAVRNKRSLAAAGNLADLLLTCIDHTKAAGQTFMVSDGHDLSTPELIRKISEAMGKSPRLLPVPPTMLRLGGMLAGKKKEIDRLIGSLQVDIGHTCKTLNWLPPVSADEAIRETVEWEMGSRKWDVEGKAGNGK